MLNGIRSAFVQLFLYMHYCTRHVHASSWNNPNYLNVISSWIISIHNGYSKLDRMKRNLHKYNNEQNVN